MGAVGFALEAGVLELKPEVRIRAEGVSWETWATLADKIAELAEYYELRPEEWPVIREECRLLLAQLIARSRQLDLVFDESKAG